MTSIKQLNEEAREYEKEIRSLRQQLASALKNQKSAESETNKMAKKWQEVSDELAKVKAVVEDMKRVIKSALIDEDCGAALFGWRKLAKLLEKHDAIQQLETEGNDE